MIFANELHVSRVRNSCLNAISCNLVRQIKKCKNVTGVVNDPLRSEDICFVSLEVEEWE